MCLMYIECIKSLESNANKDERFNIYFYEHKSYITKKIKLYLEYFSMSAYFYG